VFGHKYRYGELKLPSDEMTLDQFRLMIDVFTAHNFQHYEISNFAKEGYISKHNSAYWNDRNYLGVGPSAHSYNGAQRSWNISNNQRYINNMLDGNLVCDTENLTNKDK